MTWNLVMPEQSCYEVSGFFRDFSRSISERLAGFRCFIVNKWNQMDEVELLRGIAAGDRDAFARLYDLHSSSLFSVAARILNDFKAAEDVIQEVFIQVWNKAGSYRPELGKPIHWLLSLTRNKAVDQVRSSVRRSRLVEDAAAGRTDSVFQDGDLYTDDQLLIIRKALGELPGDQRTAIELAFFNGFSQTEIAEQLQAPLGTIKARIRRGMLKLRELLEGRI